MDHSKFELAMMMHLPLRAFFLLSCLLCISCGGERPEAKAPTKMPAAQVSADTSVQPTSSSSSALPAPPADGRFALVSAGIDRYTLTDKNYTAVTKFEGYVPLELKVLMPKDAADAFRFYEHDIEMEGDELQIDGVTYGLVIEDLASGAAFALIEKTRNTLNTLYLNADQLCDAAVSSALKGLSSKTAHPLHLFIYGDLTEAQISCIDSYKAAPLFIALESGNDRTLSLFTKLECLYSLDLESNDITDAGVESLLNIKGLKSLSLKDTFITAKALDTVGKLTELVSLSLESTEIADDGLSNLAGLTKLESLNLSDTKVQGSGLEHLKEIKNLTKMNLFDSYLSNDGAKTIALFPNLVSLNIGSTKITDKGLGFLSALSKLKSLDLEFTKIANPDFGSLSNLEQLNISKTVVDKLPSLKKLQKLTEINAQMTGFSKFDDFVHLKNLKYLDISGTNIYSLKDLVHFPKLRYLDISHIGGCNIDIESLSSIKNLTALRHLKLNHLFDQDEENGPFFDKYLSFLKNLRELRELSLQSISLDGSVLSFLNDAKKLSKIDLSKITPAEWTKLSRDDPRIKDNVLLLSNLQKLTSLKHLKLDETFVSLKELVGLASLTKLIFLSTTWFVEDEEPIFISPNDLPGFGNLKEFILGQVDQSVGLPLIERISQFKNIRALHLWAKDERYIGSIFHIDTLRMLDLSETPKTYNAKYSLRQFSKMRLLSIGIDYLNEVTVFDKRYLFNVRHLNTSKDNTINALKDICEQFPLLAGLGLRIQGNYPQTPIADCRRLKYLSYGSTLVERQLIPQRHLKSFVDKTRLKYFGTDADFKKSTLSILSGMSGIRRLGIWSNMDISKEENRLVFKPIISLPKLNTLYIQSDRFRGKDISQYLEKELMMEGETDISTGERFDFSEYCHDPSYEADDYNYNGEEDENDDEE